MKISQKQANLLAKEVHAKLVKQSRSNIPESTISKIRAFKEKRNELNAAVRAAQDDLSKHDATFKNIVGNLRGAYPGDTIESVVEELKKRAVPSVSDIEDKIVLKAMFANGDDMEKFVNGIVKDFSKKKPVSAN